MILDIRPRSLLRWQFDAFESDTLIASIDLKALKEGADIEIKGEPFRIFREGLVSGAFVLEAFDEVLARAEKPSAFRRRFVIDFAGRQFELEATSLFGRSFVMSAESAERGGKEMGRIEPVKWYKMSATATFDDELPVAVVIFAVSLALFLWKRSVQSSS